MSHLQHGHFTIEWSVMLRKRWEHHSQHRKPATCHRAIPDLDSKRYQHAVTSLDYLLIVCGGRLGD